jgi:hypothetical protein
MYYIYTELLKDKKLTFWSRLNLRFEYFRYKCIFLCYDAYFNISVLFRSNLLNKILLEDEEEEVNPNTAAENIKIADLELMKRDLERTSQSQNM